MYRLALVSLATAGCVATAAPRFPDDVAAALADHAMRRLETETLILYYPAARRELALRTAARLARCQAGVVAQTQLHGWTTKVKPVVVMPELPMNNAFVMPRLNGFENVAVVPTENTLDFATAFGLPPDPASIGCHEIVHHVHEQQIGGSWGWLNRIFGELASPQTGLDAWFWEGLATYYEGTLQPGIGRLAWPTWRGLFAAAYAGGDLDGDDLSELKRAAPPGHHYLVGSHFIEWLATTYGEDQLWQVIARQGTAVAVPLDVNGRFKSVYGSSLSSLIDKFAAHLARDLPRRGVPPGQTRLRAVGSDARYARAPDGTEAIVAEDRDVPTHLEVRAPDGRVLVSQNLIDLIPPRMLVMAATILVSGMSFTADGKTLYLTAIDLGTTYQIPRLLRLDVASGDLDEVTSGLGPGGAVSPDGKVYWLMKVDGDAWGLDELDLTTKARRTLIQPAPGRYVLRVAPSPSGARLAISQWDGTQFSIAITDRDGVVVSEIALGATTPIYDASFVDEDRLLYLADVNGRFQVMVEDLTTQLRTQVSDVPYTALEPRAAGGTIRFLDREGWQWNLAEVPLPAPVPVPVPDPVPAPEVPADPAIPVDPYTITAPGAVAPPPTLASGDPALAVLSDRSYSIFDHLFYPQLRAIALTSPTAGVLLLGLGLAGGDRLGMQRWAINGFANLAPKPVLYSVSGGYVNSMLAPWTLSLQAQDLRWHHPFDTDPDVVGYETFADRDQLDVLGSFGRVVRGSTYLALDGRYTRDRFDPAVDAGEPRRWRRLGGVGLTLAQDNLEATPYGGIRRRLALALQGAYFPRRLSTLGADLVDARGELVITAPIPATRRHALTLEVRGHAAEPRRGDVDGVPPLLEIGGAGAFTPLYQHADPLDEPPVLDDEFLPEHAQFVEPLRGFEDWILPARRAALGSLTWRYPIVIDRGWATSLWFFPAILIRELDVELFGAGALVDVGPGKATRHLTAGAALTLSVYFWRLPVLVQYQVSRRATDDEALSQLVAIGMGL